MLTCAPARGATMVHFALIRDGSASRCVERRMGTHPGASLRLGYGARKGPTSVKPQWPARIAQGHPSTYTEGRLVPSDRSQAAYPWRRRVMEPLEMTFFDRNDATPDGRGRQGGRPAVASPRSWHPSFHPHAGPTREKETPHP